MATGTARDRGHGSSGHPPRQPRSRRDRPDLSVATDRWSRLLAGGIAAVAFVLAALMLGQVFGADPSGIPAGPGTSNEIAAAPTATPAGSSSIPGALPPATGGAVSMTTPTRTTTATPEMTPPATATRAPSPAATPTPEATERPEAPTIAGAEPGTSTLVQEGTSGRREVALTFDGGDDRGNAEAILDLLAERGIVASFGITGEWAAASPDLVARMVAEGHQVFNHTWSHQSFTGFSTGTGDPGTDYRLDELERTHTGIADLGDGYDDRPYWRPPYGDLGPQTLRDADAAGYGITVMWSVDSLGWQEGETGETVAARVLDGVEPGGIVLLHLGEAASADFDALPDIIDGLQDDGYDFVTVEQILQP